MKKLISFGLSLLIILNTFGFNMIVIFLIQESRSENLEIIEEHPETIAAKKIIAISLKYDKPDFLNSKEVRINDEMYDILYSKHKDDDTILYCIIDKKETNLHTAFRSLNEMNDNPAAVPDHFVFTILKNLLKNYLPVPDNEVIQSFKTRQYYLSGLLSFLSVIPKRNYPPPQFQIVSC